MERSKPKQLKPLVASTVREKWTGGLLQSPTSHPPKKLKPKVPPASPKRFPPKNYKKLLQIKPNLVTSMDEARKGLNRSASPKKMKPRNRR